MLWNFLNTGFHSGSFNMEFDESLVKAFEQGTGTPTVRVYGWKPAAISLGWNQREEEIDDLRARADGIDVVRRPTGGRAILHSEELTYSVAMLAPSRDITSVYNDVSRALVHGLAKLGAGVSLEKSQPHFPSLYRNASSVACFSSSARYEIQVEGRKLVGSAQRRYAGRNGEDIVLQHGSILLGPDHKRLTEHLNNADSKVRKELRRGLEEKTIDLSEALGRRVSFEECAVALKSGFEQAWKIEFRSSQPQFAESGSLA